MICSICHEAEAGDGVMPANLSKIQLCDPCAVRWNLSPESKRLNQIGASLVAEHAERLRCEENVANEAKKLAAANAASTAPEGAKTEEKT